MNYTVTDNNYDRLLKKPAINTQQLIKEKEWELFGIHEISETEMRDMIKNIESSQSP